MPLEGCSAVCSQITAAVVAYVHVVNSFATPVLLQVQQDELKPRPIDSFRGRILALPDGVVSHQQQQKVDSRHFAAIPDNVSIQKAVVLQ